MYEPETWFVAHIQASREPQLILWLMDELQKGGMN